MSKRPDPFEIWLAIMSTAVTIPLVIMLWKAAL